MQTPLAEMTQRAALWTPTPTPTFNPNLTNMVNWLNIDLSDKNTLERTMDADYQVTNVSVISPNGSDLIFRVDVGCICMNKNDCCIPERTFVVIIEAMKKYPDITKSQVPSNISEIMVVCFDHQTEAQIGSISASWQNVRGYLEGSNSGHQLGVQITRTIAP